MALNKVMEMELGHNWKHEEEFELVPKCILKKYNSEVHSQSSIEALLELDKEENIPVDEINEIEATVFLTCYHIIGGGEYGDRKVVVTKEQADHSLPYLLAVAMLDKEVYPSQFTPDRINADDVQNLLKKIKVTTSFPLKEPRKLVTHLDPYTIAYPEKMMANIAITLENGKKFTKEKEDYHGFFTRPFSWDDVRTKFCRLTDGIISKEKQQQIFSLVFDFEKQGVSELTDVISQKEMVSQP
jgi:2-methylcitrate dehydratase